MSNTAIQLKKSGISGNTPNALNFGEVAINYADGKLFYRNDLDQVVYITNQDTFSSISANNELLLATSPTDILTLTPNTGISMFVDTSHNRIFLGVNESEITSFVKKSGDTITGDLVVTSNVTANKIIVNETLYSGLATQSATPLPNLIAQFTGNTDSYVQVNAQNIDPHGSGDFVVTSDVGNDTTFYIDFGIQGSQLNQGAVRALDGYVLVQGNTGQVGGNLIIGTMSGTPGQQIKFINGGTEDSNVIVIMDSTETNVIANLVVGGSISGPTITNIEQEIQTVFDVANSAGGNAFTTIKSTGYTDIVANSKTSILRFTGESGISVGMDSGNNVIAIAANLVGASNVILDYGTTSEIGYIAFDYGYLS